MGWFSSFVGGIASGIGKIVSCVSSAVSVAAKGVFKVASAAVSSLASVGGFIGNVAAGAGKILSMASSFLAGPLGPILGPIIGQLVIQAIGKAMAWVAKKIGLIKENDEVEEVGYRIEEASKHEDWETREAFGSFAEYHDYLKEKIPSNAIDRHKLEQNRLGYISLGISALKDGVGAKFGLDMPIDFLLEIGKCRLNGNELNSLLEEFSAKGYDLSLFRRFLQGELSGDMRRAVEDSILNALKTVYPEKSTENLMLQISSMRNVSRDETSIVENYKPELEKLLQKDKSQQTEQDLPRLIDTQK